MIIVVSVNKNDGVLVHGDWAGKGENKSPVGCRAFLISYFSTLSETKLIYGRATLRAANN
jgi:hypothetical protein